MRRKEWSGRAVRRFVLVALAIGLCLPLLVGCGEEAEKKKPGEKKAAVGKTLGQEIGDVWRDAMTETHAVIESKPPAAEALPEVKQIKEKYVKILVGYGKEREKLDDEGKKKVDRDVLGTLMAPENRELAKKYTTLVNSTYCRIVTAAEMAKRSEAEKELAKLLPRMNTITQYADFELLKKQEPQEAKRLGIK